MGRTHDFATQSTRRGFDKKTGQEIGRARREAISQQVSEGFHSRGDEPSGFGTDSKSCRHRSIGDKSRASSRGPCEKRPGLNMMPPDDLAAVYLAAIRASEAIRAGVMTAADQAQADVTAQADQDYHGNPDRAAGARNRDRVYALAGDGRQGIYDRAAQDHFDRVAAASDTLARRSARAATPMPHTRRTGWRPWTLKPSVPIQNHRRSAALSWPNITPACRCRGGLTSAALSWPKPSHSAPGARRHSAATARWLRPAA